MQELFWLDSKRTGKRESVRRLGGAERGQEKGVGAALGWWAAVHAGIVLVGLKKDWEKRVGAALGWCGAGLAEIVVFEIEFTL